MTMDMTGNMGEMAITDMVTDMVIMTVAVMITGAAMAITMDTAKIMATSTATDAKITIKDGEGTITTNMARIRDADTVTSGADTDVQIAEGIERITNKG